MGHPVFIPDAANSSVQAAQETPRRACALVEADWPEFPLIA
jgi:hypothetical protein